MKTVEARNDVIASETPDISRDPKSEIITNCVAMLQEVMKQRGLKKDQEGGVKDWIK